MFSQRTTTGNMCRICINDKHQQIVATNLSERVVERTQCTTPNCSESRNENNMKLKLYWMVCIQWPFVVIHFPADRVSSFKADTFVWRRRRRSQFEFMQFHFDIFGWCSSLRKCSRSQPKLRRCSMSLWPSLRCISQQQLELISTGDSPAPYVSRSICVRGNFQ